MRKLGLIAEVGQSAGAEDRTRAAVGVRTLAGVHFSALPESDQPPSLGRPNKP
jgi:hypothetical protein